MTMAPVGALTKQNTGEWLEFFERQRTDPRATTPRTYLLGLPDLPKAVRKPNSAGDRSNDLGVAISDAELGWLRDIHGEVRNQLVHFEPMGWSIEVSGVPELACTVSRILSEILHIGWAFRHFDPEERRLFEMDLQRLATIDWPKIEADQFSGWRADDEGHPLHSPDRTSTSGSLATRGRGPVWEWPLRPIARRCF